MSTWIELISEPMRAETVRLDLSYPDIGDLLPVAIVCGISILLAGLWLLAVLECTWLRDRHLL
jgi:hypothetical protein